MRLGILILINTFFLFLAANSQSISFGELKSKWITKETRANFGEVNALYEDSLGVIWLGIFGKGLSYFDGIDFYRVSIQDEELFANHPKCFEKYKHRLYLNSNTYLSVFDPVAKKIEARIPFETDAGQHINELCFIEKDGILNIFTFVPVRQSGNEIFYQIYVSENYAPFRLLRSENFMTRGPIVAKSILDHQLLLKSDSEFLIYNPFTFTQQKVELPDFNMEQMTSDKIAVDRKAQLWLLKNCKKGEQRTGNCPSLQVISLKDGKLERETILDKGMENYSKVTLDTLGNYLILDKYAIDIENLKIQRNIHSRLIPGSILTRNGIIFSGDISGLYQFQTHQSAFKKIGPIAGRTMAELPDGKIIGTVASDPLDILTSIYNPEKDSVYASDLVSIARSNAYQFAYHKEEIYTKNFKQNIRNGRRVNFDQIHEDLKSPLLTLIDLKGRQWKASWDSPIIGLYSNSGERINTVHVEALQDTKVQLNDWYERPSNNTIWLGSSGLGIFIFAEDGNILHHLSRSAESKVKLNNNHVSGFYEDSNRNMWIAHGAGISKISADLSEIEHFVLNENNPESHIFYSILPDDNEDFLWLSSSQGIFRFDIKAKRFGSFPLDKDIMSYEYNRTSFLKTKSGEIFYGTSNVNKPTVRFMPSEVIQSYKKMAVDTLSQISIQFCKIDYKDDRPSETKVQDLNNDQKIIFDKDLSAYEIKFFLTNYSATDEIYYSYKLEKYDEDWSPLKKGNNVVKHKNLKPGKYTLRLRAGLFQEAEFLTEKSIPIVVKPYWYQTWWSKLLFVLLLASALFFIYRYNIKRQFDQQENRRLKDLDQLKTRLYTNITHEFRTPLSVILGMTDSIESYPKETSLINRNARSLLQLIDQLLDLSKLDSGKIEVEMIYADLVAYIKYLVESFFSMASGKRIRLSFESSSKEMYLHFDEQKMQHIIFNLLSNAIKFTKPGGKILASLDFKEGEILFSVKDTGIGIADKDKPFLFDRYYQVKNKKESTNNYVAGTGLGLAFTKELLDLMGGSIEVNSRVNWGSEFIVRIPSSDQPKLDRQFKINNGSTTSLNSIPVASDQLDDHKPSVLLVEDNDGVAQYVQSLLKEDFYLQWAINGQEGVDLAIQQIPDIIITDVMMPEKNGFELTDILKKDERTSHIPIIVLTAKADMNSKLEGLERGADAYLSKPFEKKELMVRVKKLLELRTQLQKHYSMTNSLEEEHVPIKPPNMEQQFISKINDIIKEHKQHKDLSIQFIAQEMGLSHIQFYRKLKALTGITPVAYLRKFKLKLAINYLKTTDMNVSEIAYEVGFNDPNYFSRAFKAEFGNSPKDYRE